MIFLVPSNGQQYFAWISSLFTRGGPFLFRLSYCFLCAVLVCIHHFLSPVIILDQRVEIVGKQSEQRGKHAYTLAFVVFAEHVGSTHQVSALSPWNAGVCRRLYGHSAFVLRILVLFGVDTDELTRSNDLHQSPIPVQTVGVIQVELPLLSLLRSPLTNNTVVIHCRNNFGWHTSIKFKHYNVRNNLILLDLTFYVESYLQQKNQAWIFKWAYWVRAQSAKLWGAQLWQSSFART